MGMEAGVPVGLQGFGHHERAKIGTADPDIDDIPDRFSRITLPLSRKNIVRKTFHLFQDGIDFRHDIRAIDKERLIGPVPQRHMKDGAVLGFVNLFAGKHLLHRLFQPALPGHCDQETHRFPVDDIFGVIDEDLLESGGKGWEPAGIPAKEVRHGPVPHRLIMLF